ncbi:MAG: hypothetical protein WA208_06570 [Thermoanaerobaculia bacterium]
MSGYYQQAAILAAFVERVRAAGLPCGETLLQKGAFVMKELFGVPLDDEFRIHYYGPFSFQLRERLASMEADEIVQVRPRELGVIYDVGGRYEQLKTRHSDAVAEARRAIDWTAEHLGKLGVKDLEPLATALYVTRETAEQPIDERVKRLRELKQHIDEPSARHAVATVDRWLSETRETV